MGYILHKAGEQIFYQRIFQKLLDVLRPRHGCSLWRLLCSRLGLLDWAFRCGNLNGLLHGGRLFGRQIARLYRCQIGCQKRQNIFHRTDEMVQIGSDILDIVAKFPYGAAAIAQ